MFDNDIEEGLKVSNHQNTSCFNWPVLSILFNFLCCLPITLLSWPSCIHTVNAPRVLTEFYFICRSWRLKETRQRCWKMILWTFLPKRKSLRKWTLMKERCWRKKMVRINHVKITVIKEDTCNSMVVYLLCLQHWRMMRGRTMMEFPSALPRDQPGLALNETTLMTRYTSYI